MSTELFCLRQVKPSPTDSTSNLVCVSCIPCYNVCSTERDNCYFSIHPHVKHTRNKTKPYRLVLCDNILENRDLVEADWVAFIIKDHKTSVRCVVFDVLRGKSGRQKKTCGLFPQSRTKGRLRNLHFVLPGHPYLYTIVSSRKQMLPLGCQRPARIRKIFKGASEEAEDWIVVRLSTPS